MSLVIKDDDMRQCACGVYTDLRIGGYRRKIVICRACIREVSEDFAKMERKEKEAHPCD